MHIDIEDLVYYVPVSTTKRTLRLRLEVQSFSSDYSSVGFIIGIGFGNLLVSQGACTYFFSGDRVVLPPHLNMDDWPEDMKSRAHHAIAHLATKAVEDRKSRV